MKKFGLPSIVSNLCLTVVIIGLCVGLAAPVVQASDFSQSMAEADQLYPQREDAAKAEQALKLYRQIAAANTDKCEAAWKLSRMLYFVSIGKAEDEKLALLEEGIISAKKAVKIDPENVAGYYWLGTLYGIYGQTKGVMKSLSLVDPIKEAMAEVIKRRPEYEDGGAYTILGRLFFKVPGFFGGSDSKAMENFQTALKYGPSRGLTHVYLAELYMDDDEFDKANEHLEKVLGDTCDGPKGVSCRKWQNDAKKVMAKLREKKG